MDKIEQTPTLMFWLRKAKRLSRALAAETDPLERLKICRKIIESSDRLILEVDDQAKRNE